jgi:hypothetical protein
MTYTPAQIVEKYLELRETKKQLKAEYDKKIAEYDSVMEAIENHLLAVMQERGEKQIKTDAGVAFQQTATRVKLVDRPLLLAYVRDTEDFDVFTNAVSKERIVTLFEAGTPVPGVEVTRLIETHVRKA